jgi:3-oxoacyl-[acyl-carrier protein] reductase
MDLGIEGRSAVVTGASSGIGRATALALGRAGVRLAVVARRGERLDELAAEVVEAGGPEPAPLVIDMQDEEAAERVAAGARAALGPLQILVNNAGGSRPFAWDADEAAWQEALTLNFTRHRQVTTRLLPDMIDRGWGRVINITGKSEPEGVNGAFAAKAAVHSWAKGLSREVGPHGVTVNSIPPGRIMSEQIERNYSAEYRAWQSEHEIPMGRYGDPNDIANLVCFLASPLAGYITGTVIPVDGGLRRYQF